MRPIRNVGDALLGIRQGNTVPLIGHKWGSLSNIMFMSCKTLEQTCLCKQWAMLMNTWESIWKSKIMFNGAVLD